eukprot:g19163.t1
MVKKRKKQKEDEEELGSEQKWHKGETSKPSALKMLKIRKGRQRTISVALPVSILDNAQKWDLKALLVGQVARALTIYGIDEWPPPTENEKGCWVNCGLSEPVWLEGKEIAGDVRVTVRLEEDRAGPRLKRSGECGTQRGVAVEPSEPRTKCGLYWGFQTRLAKSLKAVFEEQKGGCISDILISWRFQLLECPFGRYDLTVGTSERGEALGFGRLPKFQHLLLAFGGLGGFEEVISDPVSGYEASTDPASLFTRYVNVCPRQKSRTIRASVDTGTAAGMPDLMDLVNRPRLAVDKENHYAFVVLGAAGDLAKKKTFPSLFQLHMGRLLPGNMHIIGVDNPQFHKEPIERLHYVQVQLDQPDTVVALDRHLRSLAEDRPKEHRVFYLALPPFLFAKAVENLRERCWSQSGWNRVIVEKPFGKNGTQAAELTDIALRCAGEASAAHRREREPSDAGPVSH